MIGVLVRHRIATAVNRYRVRQQASIDRGIVAVDEVPIKFRIDVKLILPNDRVIRRDVTGRTFEV
jgi:hypothetical protein